MSPLPGPAPSLPDGIDDQTFLPTADDTPERPAIKTGNTVIVNCPKCGVDVSGTRRPHRIDSRHIADDVEVKDDDIPVYGWRCERCRIVLPIDPSRQSPVNCSLGPANGWIAVQAQLRDETARVLVPQKEVFII